jgi:uncharacterized protein
MTSCLYECHLLHHRFSPKTHRFRNRLFFFCLDLDEVEKLGRRLRLFSSNRRNLYSLRDDDFLPIEEESPWRRMIRQGSGRGVREKVDRVLAREGIDLEGGKVMLVAVPRILGYLFNPVSFFFCFGPDGEPRCAVVEVTNTYREVKTYVLRPETRKGGGFLLRAPKNFYVSPFSSAGLTFEFSLRVPGDDLVVRIDEYDGERLVLHSVVAGKRRDLTDRNLALFAGKYPFLSAGIMLLIHVQALLLYLKRIPHRRKADDLDLQQGVLRPHSSLRSHECS